MVVEGIVKVFGPVEKGRLPRQLFECKLVVHPLIVPSLVLRYGNLLGWFVHQKFWKGAYEFNHSINMAVYHLH